MANKYSKNDRLRSEKTKNDLKIYKPPVNIFIKKTSFIFNKIVIKL